MGNRIIHDPVEMCFDVLVDDPSNKISILLSDGENKHWFPRDWIEVKYTSDKEAYVIMPKWLAVKKGLLKKAKKLKKG